MTADAWRADAACRDLDPNQFFPVGSRDLAALRTTALAKRICRTCPVRRECLIDALDDPATQDLGIRGGLTEDERALLRQGRPAQPSPINHGTEAGYAAHRRRDEQPCDACTGAATRANSERRARRAAAS